MELLLKASVAGVLAWLAWRLRKRRMRPPDQYVSPSVRRRYRREA